MRKRTRRTLIAGAVAALAIVGGGAAFAAQSGGDPNAESKLVLTDAAKLLGVDATKLSSALKQALANRVDAAVKAGQLTEAQGKELKARIQADAFPILGLRGGGHHGRGFHHLEAAATYLGVTEAALRTSLESGKTLAQVAKDKGKSVDGLIAALVADKTKELDAAVAAGRLTKAQRDELAANLKERVTAHVNGELPSGGARLHRHSGFGGPGFGSAGSSVPSPTA
jgi:urease accessory protein UreF